MPELLILQRKITEMNFKRGAKAVYKKHEQGVGKDSGKMQEAIR